MMLNRWHRIGLEGLALLVAGLLTAPLPAATVVDLNDIAAWDAPEGLVLTPADEGMKMTGSGVAFLAQPELDNDYRVRVRAQLVGGKGYGIFIAARKIDPLTEGIGFQYDPGANGFRLVNLTTDKDLMPPVLIATNNLVHEIVLTVTDGELRVHVDDTEIFRHEFPDPPAGKIALRVWGKSEVQVHALEISRRRR
jgi:hypothetical protein